MTDREAMALRRGDVVCYVWGGEYRYDMVVDSVRTCLFGDDQDGPMGVVVDCRGTDPEDPYEHAGGYLPEGLQLAPKREGRRNAFAREMGALKSRSL